MNIGPGGIHVKENDPFLPLQELWNGHTAGKLIYFPRNPDGLVRPPVIRVQRINPTGRMKSKV